MRRHLHDRFDPSEERLRTAGPVEVIFESDSPGVGFADRLERHVVRCASATMNYRARQRREICGRSRRFTDRYQRRRQLFGNRRRTMSAADCIQTLPDIPACREPEHLEEGHYIGRCKGANNATVSCFYIHPFFLRPLSQTTMSRRFLKEPPPQSACRRGNRGRALNRGAIETEASSFPEGRAVYLSTNSGPQRKKFQPPGPICEPRGEPSVPVSHARLC